MRVTFWPQFLYNLQVRHLWGIIDMTERNQKTPPLSETYAGFAWEYLRRNVEYTRDYHSRNLMQKPNVSTNNITVRYEANADKLAHHWGLECFVSPSSVGLDAIVVWRQDAFPGALSVQCHNNFSPENNKEYFNLSKENIQNAGR